MIQRIGQRLAVHAVEVTKQVLILFIGIRMECLVQAQMSGANQTPIIRLLGVIIINHQSLKDCF